MKKTTIRLSEFTLEQLREIARQRGTSVNHLINEIALQYIGAHRWARVMEVRAMRCSKTKARAAVRACGSAVLEGV